MAKRDGAVLEPPRLVSGAVAPRDPWRTARPGLDHLGGSGLAWAGRPPAGAWREEGGLGGEDSELGWVSLAEGDLEQLEELAHLLGDDVGFPRPRAGEEAQEAASEDPGERTGDGNDEADEGASGETDGDEGRGGGVGAPGSPIFEAWGAGETDMAPVQPSPPVATRPKPPAERVLSAIEASIAAARRFRESGGGAVSRSGAAAALRASAVALTPDVLAAASPNDAKLLVVAWEDAAAAVAPATYDMGALGPTGPYGRELGEGAGRAVDYQSRETIEEELSMPDDGGGHDWRWLPGTTPGLEGPDGPPLEAAGLDTYADAFVSPLEDDPRSVYRWFRPREAVRGIPMPTWLARRTAREQLASGEGAAPIPTATAGGQGVAAAPPGGGAVPDPPGNVTALGALAAGLSDPSPSAPVGTLAELLDSLAGGEAAARGGAGHEGGGSPPLPPPPPRVATQLLRLPGARHAFVTTRAAIDDGAEGASPHLLPPALEGEEGRDGAATLPSIPNPVGNERDGYLLEAGAHRGRTVRYHRGARAASAVREDAPEVGRARLESLLPGDVFVGTVRALHLLHGVQVDVGACYDGLIPAKGEEAFERLCQLLDVGSPVAVQVHRVWNLRVGPGRAQLYRWPVQLEALDSEIAAVVPNPEAFSPPWDWGAVTVPLAELAPLTERTFAPARYRLQEATERRLELELGVEIHDRSVAGWARAKAELRTYRDAQARRAEAQIEARVRGRSKSGGRRGHRAVEGQAPRTRSATAAAASAGADVAGDTVSAEGAASAAADRNGASPAGAAALRPGPATRAPSTAPPATAPAAEGRAGSAAGRAGDDAAPPPEARAMSRAAARLIALTSGVPWRKKPRLTTWANRYTEGDVERLGLLSGGGGGGEARRGRRLPATTDPSDPRAGDAAGDSGAGQLIAQVARPTSVGEGSASDDSDSEGIASDGEGIASDASESEITASDDSGSESPASDDSDSEAPLRFAPEVGLQDGTGEGRRARLERRLRARGFIRVGGPEDLAARASEPSLEEMKAAVLARSERGEGEVAPLGQRAVKSRERGSLTDAREGDSDADSSIGAEWERGGEVAEEWSDPVTESVLKSLEVAEGSDAAGARPGAPGALVPALTLMRAGLPPPTPRERFEELARRAALWEDSLKELDRSLRGLVASRREAVRRRAAALRAARSGRAGGAREARLRARAAYARLGGDPRYWHAFRGGPRDWVSARRLYREGVAPWGDLPPPGRPEGAGDERSPDDAPSVAAGREAGDRPPPAAGARRAPARVMVASVGPTPTLQPRGVLRDPHARRRVMDTYPPEFSGGHPALGVRRPTPQNPYPNPPFLDPWSDDEGQPEGVVVKRFLPDGTSSVGSFFDPRQPAPRARGGADGGPRGRAAPTRGRWGASRKQAARRVNPNDPQVDTEGEPLRELELAPAADRESPQAQSLVAKRRRRLLASILASERLLARGARGQAGG